VLKNAPKCRVEIVRQQVKRDRWIGSIGRFFAFFGENFGEYSAENFFSKKRRGKLEFSAEKVSKNYFPKKFRGKFRGKNVRKIGHCHRIGKKEAKSTTKSDSRFKPTERAEAGHDIALTVRCRKSEDYF
jgi:hypothetical protein